jgi:hypothetical protein
MKGLDLPEPGVGREVVFAESGAGRHVMARTRDRKLLVEGERELLFDLAKDPCELEDVSGDAAYAGDLSMLRTAARHWRDASHLPETHVDEDAPVIHQPNVPDRDDDHRERIRAWTRAQVETTGRLQPE